MPFFSRSKPTVTPFPLYAYPTQMIPGDLPTSLEKRYNLISLREASQRPEVVYHCMGKEIDTFTNVDAGFCDGYYADRDNSTETLAESSQPAQSVKSHLVLIPLAVAAKRKDIKYRREGFEMLEAREHIRALRADC